MGFFDLPERDPEDAGRAAHIPSGTVFRTMRARAEAQGDTP